MPQQPSIPSDPSPSPSSPDKGTLWGILFYAITVVFFWGVIQALWQNIRLEENFQAICILSLLAIYLVYLNRQRMRPIFNFDAMSMCLLGVSYALLVLAGVATPQRPELLLFPAFCVSLASLLRFVFGPKAKRVYYALLGGFALYLLFVVFYPISGFSTSLWSAYGAGWLLQQFDYPAARLIHSTEGGMISTFLWVKVVDTQVLIDCRGFGLLSAGLLVSFVLLIYRKTPLFAKLLWLAWTVFFVYAINVGRICLTVLLAPHFQAKAALLQAGFELAALYLIIWALWYMLAGWPLRDKQ